MRLVFALAITLSPAAAIAGGVFVPGYGSQAQPRAGAFLAKADDPSALFHNPAGLAKMTGTVIHIGFNLVDFSQTFQRAGNYEDPAFSGPYPEAKDESTPAIGIGEFQGIPLVAVSTDLGLDLPIRFGAGLIAAHGYPERLYAEDYVFEDPNEPPPPGRYDVLEQDVFVAFPSIAVAYSPIEKLDVGARLSYGFAGLKGKTAVWGVRNYDEEIASDGIFDVDVSDNWVPTFGIGVLYRPTDRIEIGANYRSAANIGAKGEGTAQIGSGLGLAGMPETIEPENVFPLCEAGGTAEALKACVDLSLPQVAGIGGRFIFRNAAGKEIGDVELDVQWENWSSAGDIEVIVDGKSGLTGLPLNPTRIRHEFDDTFSIRLGGSYGFPVGKNTLSVRAGAAYDTAAAPEEFTRLDLDGLARTTLGLGVGFEMSRVRIEVGGGAVLEGERTVSTNCNPDVATPTCAGFGRQDLPSPAQPLQGQNNQVLSPFNDGTYDQSYLLLSLGVTTWF